MRLIASPIRDKKTLFNETSIAKLRKQELPVQHVVIHITGRQTYQHAEKKKIAPLKRIELVTAPKGNWAHYYIDPWGRALCIAPETVVPHSQGWSQYGGRSGLKRKIQSKELIVPQWWLSTWDDCQSLGSNRIDSPVAIIDKKLYSGNDRTVSIEFIQYGGQCKLTEAQYKVGREFLLDICARHRLEFKRPDIIGHEDLDPWGRGNKNRGWDPGAWPKDGKETFCYECMLRPEQGCTCKAKIPTPPMPDWAC